jgi:exopolysaccharide production protein ExoY
MADSLMAEYLPTDAYVLPVGGAIKRSIDIFIAVAGITILLPLFILCALGVLMTSRGPIIYGHRRVGFGGRSFKCLKFRSMRSDSDERLRAHLLENPEATKEWEETRKLRRDPRITRFGAILRKSSLDEIPQLFNVLLGHMSIVGPRPVTPDETAKYETKLRSYLSCKPGITGLWQVSGRSNTSYDERVSLDCSYAQNWTLLLDAKIIAKTLPAVLASEGAV